MVRSAIYLSCWIFKTSGDVLQLLWNTFSTAVYHCQGKQPGKQQQQQIQFKLSELQLLSVTFFIPSFYSMGLFLLLVQFQLPFPCFQTGLCHWVSFVPGQTSLTLSVLRSSVLRALTILEIFGWPLPSFLTLNWVCEAPGTGRLHWMAALLQPGAFFLFSRASGCWHSSHLLPVSGSNPKSWSCSPVATTGIFQPPMNQFLLWAQIVRKPNVTRAVAVSSLFQEDCIIHLQFPKRNPCTEQKCL